MKLLDKMARILNIEIREILPLAIKDKFGLDVTTGYEFLISRLVTRREDGSDFTKEQLRYIDAFMDGYTRAMNRVTEEANKR